MGSVVNGSDVGNVVGSTVGAGVGSGEGSDVTLWVGLLVGGDVLSSEGVGVGACVVQSLHSLNPSSSSLHLSQQSLLAR